MEKSITVKEYFERRAKGETVKAIAEELGKSPKAINRSLERLGYIANDKNEWIYQGAEVENLDQSLPFGRGQTIPKGKKETKTKVEETPKASKKLVIASNSNDAIQSLLEKQETENKSYRGYYFAEDVLQVIDNVRSGNKSELINEILRKEFKSRGLL